MNDNDSNDFNDNDNNDFKYNDNTAIIKQERNDDIVTVLSHVRYTIRSAIIISFEQIDLTWHIL